MQGYLNNKIETNKVLIDGWFYTGDIAIQDQDGYIFIKGRKKEMILVGGYNVYPKEIEDCIKNFSNLNVAVVGVSDENLGEKEIKEDYRKGYKIGNKAGIIGQRNVSAIRCRLRAWRCRVVQKS